MRSGAVIWKDCFWMRAEMKKIGILGSTGSIGTQTLDIVRKEKDLEVVSLAAGSNVSLLEAQIREFRPQIAALWEERAAVRRSCSSVASPRP